MVRLECEITVPREEPVTPLPVPNANYTCELNAVLRSGSVSVVMLLEVFYDVIALVQCFASSGIDEIRDLVLTTEFP